MTKWQPIETAPKDCEFLAYDSIADKMDVCVKTSFATFPVECVMQTHSDGEYGPEIGEFGYDYRGITHWMPLPEKPG